MKTDNYPVLSIVNRIVAIRFAIEGNVHPQDDVIVI